MSGMAMTLVGLGRTGEGAVVVSKDPRRPLGLRSTASIQPSPSLRPRLGLGRHRFLGAHFCLDRRSGWAKFQEPLHVGSLPSCSPLVSQSSLGSLYKINSAKEVANRLDVMAYCSFKKELQASIRINRILGSRRNAKCYGNLEQKLTNSAGEGRGWGPKHVT